MLCYLSNFFLNTFLIKRILYSAEQLANDLLFELEEDWDTKVQKIVALYYPGHAFYCIADPAALTVTIFNGGAGECVFLYFVFFYYSLFTFFGLYLAHNRRIKEPRTRR